MFAQQVNRLTRSRNRNRTTLIPNAAAPPPIRDPQTGFIHHPSGFPLECRRLWFSEWFQRRTSGGALPGLMFNSDRYLPPGALVEISIPVRGELETFRGRVVLVRHNGGHYEVGLHLRHREDAGRVRIIEQICHIETYLNQKKFVDGPYNLNRERAAEEWISRFASSVPTL